MSKALLSIYGEDLIQVIGKGKVTLLLGQLLVLWSLRILSDILLLSCELPLIQPVEKSNFVTSHNYNPDKVPVLWKNCIYLLLLLSLFHVCMGLPDQMITSCGDYLLWCYRLMASNCDKYNNQEIQNTRFKKATIQTSRLTVTFRQCNCK